MPIAVALTVPPTIKRIIDAAIAEFGQKGEDATKIDDIAARAGISKQLIYHYYGTKHALYISVLEAICDVEHLRILTINFDEMAPLDAIVEFFSTIMDTNLTNNHFFAIDQILHLANDSSSRKAIGQFGKSALRKLTDIIERGQREGHIRDDVAASQLFLHMLLLSTGFANFRVIMPQYIGADFTGQTAEDNWRKHAVESVLAAVKRQGDH